MRDNSSASLSNHGGIDVSCGTPGSNRERLAQARCLEQSITLHSGSGSRLNAAARSRMDPTAMISTRRVADRKVSRIKRTPPWNGSG
jgi:hypothetical protein